MKIPLLGFFVDWDGGTRKVESPGEGIRCVVRLSTLQGIKYLSVDVVDSCDFVIHEATYFESLDALRSAGVVVRLCNL